ncbi:hypothetical protein NDU88_003211 [Pleurodeles waltl]|uniref:Uncharacterized protein n=1 Tax=Pleurodeles waltl TaxID=8319 RepID=A0AAV7MQJ6_PLEWA|nr:hypothetical protein NDU88_003211 [Pleurodeles waltl]
MRGAVLTHHHIRLRASVKDDLQMWIVFLQDFNRVTMLVEDSDWFWQILIFSDVSGANGFGLFWDGHWAAEAWPVASGSRTEPVLYGLLGIHLFVELRSNFIAAFWLATGFRWGKA